MTYSRAGLGNTNPIPLVIYERLNPKQQQPHLCVRHCIGNTWTLLSSEYLRTATVGLDVVQSGRPIFDDFFQHLWPYIGNNTANVVFQMVKRLWLIHIDQ
ncbi:hypothetical protein TNCV_2658301 [Trichonephila clavipes]|nr:hypothetical protein TNCV_2658301 [Trichonephila clavipes]